MNPLYSMLYYLDLACCFTCSFLTAWIIRQTLHGHFKHEILFRVSLAMVSFTMLLKGIERWEGDPPTIVDASRDLGWTLLLLAVILFNRKRFAKL